MLGFGVVKAYIERWKDGAMAAKSKRISKSGLSNAALVAATAVGKSAAAKRKARGGKFSIASVLKAQMPGWTLAHDESELMPGVEDTIMKSETGPSIAQLRSKFLGGSAVDAVDTGEDALGNVDTSVETVRIRPSRGGPAKTADIKNGKVSIVQG
jgi:hypothetical protein